MVTNKGGEDVPNKLWSKKKLGRFNQYNYKIQLQKTTTTTNTTKHTKTNVTTKMTTNKTTITTIDITTQGGTLSLKSK